MSRLWRWLIPLAAVPVLGLLAYGFRVDPRAVPSPLIGRPRRSPWQRSRGPRYPWRRRAAKWWC
jgi:hypothetical protein